MASRSDRGFTLIELLIVVAIIGIVAAIAVPGLLRARMAGNEVSAIGSLRSINNGQANFSAVCGYGAYAASLEELSKNPVPGGDGFISLDMAADPSQKSGFIVTFIPGDAAGGLPPSCNEAAQVVSYAVTANPITTGMTGSRYFFTNPTGTIYQDYDEIEPVFDGPPAAPATAIN